jgi:predicted dienelactone hydrolase
MANPAKGLDAVVAINGFGSLLWGRDGLKSLDLPVLMIGGSLDLVTSPLREQLLPFQQLTNKRNRLAVIEGASHFSAVRIEKEQPIMQLGADFVGKEPLQVQSMLLEIQAGFIASIAAKQTPLIGKFNQGGVQAYVIDRSWLKQLQPLSEITEVKN